MQEFESWHKIEKQEEKKPVCAPGYQGLLQQGEMPLSQLHYKQHRDIQPTTPQLSDLISVLSFLLPSPPEAERQDVLGSPAPKQLRWHLASRAWRCLTLECFVAGEMNAQPPSCMSEGITGRRKPDKQFSRCRRMVSLPERGDTQQCLPQQVLGPEVESRIWARRERNKESCESCPHLN